MPAKPRKRAPKRRFGSVRQLPSGLYQARYPDPASGRLVAAPERFIDKTSAGAWLDEKEVEIRRGRWVDPRAGATTFREWAERWYASVQSGLKPKTANGYRRILDNFIYPTFADVKLGVIRPIDVNEWKTKLVRRKSKATGKPLSPSQVVQGYRLLSQIMKAAVDNDLIGRSPCRGIKLPRLPEGDPVIVDRDQADAIITAARPGHDVLISLLYFGGLRIGEAFALRRRCWDSAARTLTVAESVEEVNGYVSWGSTKSSKTRAVKLPAFVADRLDRHLRTRPDEPDALIFVGRTLNVLRYNSWRRTYFDPAVVAAGLSGITPHDLRATHGTWVAKRFGVMAAARRLGHANSSVTTRHYARVFSRDDQDIADGLDLDTRATGTAGDLARNWHDTGNGMPADQEHMP